MPPHDLGQAPAAGERSEHRVEVVQRVPDLVDRQLLRLAQLPGLVEGVGLEEESDLVAGIEELAVLAVPAFAGLEHRPDARGIESASSSAMRARRRSQVSAGTKPSSIRKPSAGRPPAARA